MKVQGKTILVTGGGNGMGREMVLNLLSRGSNVIAVDINGQALAETAYLAKDKEGFLTNFAADISDKDSVERLFEKSVSTVGAVDGIINNAGIIQPFQRLNDTGFEIIDRVFDVNFRGTLYMTKIFLPHLLSRPEAHIVNISSMGGFLPVAGQTVYGASKAAVKMLTEGLNSELSETNVTVSVVFPGAIRTNIAAHSGCREADVEPDAREKPLTSLIPSKAAQIIIDGMERNKERIYVGRDSKLMNLIYKLYPGLAVGMVGRQTKNKM